MIYIRLGTVLPSLFKVIFGRTVDVDVGGDDSDVGTTKKRDDGPLVLGLVQ